MGSQRVGHDLVNKQQQEAEPIVCLLYKKCHLRRLKEMPQSNTLPAVTACMCNDGIVLFLGNNAVRS